MELYQLDGWEKQYQYKVGKKKVYMPPSLAEQQGYERASKYPKSTRYGRQNPISERWNSEEQLQIWRKKWADISNKYLEIAKSENRIDHRSFADRGIDEQPTIHEGIFARIIEQKGGVSERCEINRQIKTDNKILREIKATIKKLLETSTHTVSTLANAFEKLRWAMLHHRYVIKFADMWKTAKSFEVANLKIKYDDYTAVITELKSKISERKKKQAEKDKTPPIKIFKHRELTQAINELSEQIEELKTEKNTILLNLNTTDIKSVKDKISTIQKAMPVMEKHSAESAAKLDKAQKEYADLKERAKQFDEDELFSERYKIRPQIEKDTISDLQKIYGNSFSTEMFDEVKKETDKSIGETEKRSILKRLEKAKHKTTSRKKQSQNRDKENER